MFVSRWTISDMKDDGVAAFAKQLFTQMFEVCKPLCVRMFVSLKFNLEKKAAAVASCNTVCIFSTSQTDSN